MATKKTMEEKKEQEILEEQLEEIKAEPADEWLEEIEMIVPRKPKGEDQQYYVCVNDRRFAVPADGKLQKLPKPIAQVLQDALDAEIAADEFADSMPNMDAVQPALR